jgi:hypothetical protein
VATDIYKLSKGTIYNKTVGMESNELVEQQYEQKLGIQEVDQNLPVCEYGGNTEVEYYVISDSDESDNRSFHEGFDGFGMYMFTNKYRFLMFLIVI